MALTYKTFSRIVDVLSIHTNKKNNVAPCYYFGMAMGYQRRTLFIIGSSLLAVILISTAYISSGPTIFSTKTVGAESTHDLLVSYASKDTDSDGLPDWQESLYGTDPGNAHSVNASVTDSEAVAQGLVQPKFKTATSSAPSASSIPGPDSGPTTLTDQFGKDLFGQYLLSVGKGQPSSAEVAAFVEQGVAVLKQNHATPDTFNQGQVKVFGTGPDALLSYAATVEKIITRVDAGKSKDELSYFSDAVYKNDAKALSMVKKYSSDYATAGRALMGVAVPKELATAHLKLANGLMQVSESLGDMSVIQTDPLRAMLGMATYKDTSTEGRDALKDMSQVFKSENVQPEAGTAGSTFYHYLSVSGAN